MNKGSIFVGCYTHLKVLVAIYHILKGEFKKRARAVARANFRSGNEDGNASIFDTPEEKTSGQVGIDSRVLSFMWPTSLGCQMA